MKTSLEARAKINLHLDVGPRRSDGFHSLRTLFQEITLHDKLYFQLTSHALKLNVKGRRLSAGPDNLVIKALSMLRQKLNVKKGMAVTLTKNIPMGAGLGGGSSDAAAALWAGWALWTKKHFSIAQHRRVVPQLLRTCAAQLGADVSFFLRGGRAWGRGKGEKLSCVSRYPKKWLVLVYPRVHVSTAKAYSWLDESRKSVIARLRWAGRPAKQSHNFFNSFESVVVPRFPAIGETITTLHRLGCTNVLMSGSGAAVFGFVRNEREGQRIKRLLARKSWDVFVSRMI